MLLRLQTPLALLDRLKKNGGKEIRDVMNDWKFWIPTKKGQVIVSSTACVLLQQFNLLFNNVTLHFLLHCCRAHSREVLSYSKGRPVSGNTLILLQRHMSMLSNC